MGVIVIVLRRLATKLHVLCKVTYVVDSIHEHTLAAEALTRARSVPNGPPGFVVVLEELVRGVVALTGVVAIVVAGFIVPVDGILVVLVVDSIAECASSCSRFLF